MVGTMARFGSPSRRRSWYQSKILRVFAAASTVGLVVYTALNAGPGGPDVQLARRIAAASNLAALQDNMTEGTGRKTPVGSRHSRRSSFD